VKSDTVIVTVVVSVVELLIPVTVTVYEPLVTPLPTVTVSVDVAELPGPTVTLGGFGVAVMPLPLGGVADKVMVPEKEFTLVTVMVDVPDAPCVSARIGGLEEILNP
jgi:hypothetical protein